MIFIETTAFTRRVQALLTDEAYSALQTALVKQPNLGSIIRGSGGIRKLRWGAAKRGTRGGIRVIYYWAVAQDVILLLLTYPKSEKDDLTAQELKLLRQIVEEEFL